VFLRTFPTAPLTFQAVISSAGYGRSKSTGMLDGSAGRMSLDAAQRGIASDWTQYLPDAERWCGTKGRC